MIQVICPRCRTPLAFDEIFAERRVACPDCGASVPVPDLPGRAATHEPIVLDDLAIGHSYQDEAVLAELHGVQTQKTGWGAGLGILGVSLLLYLGAAGLQQIWEGIFILIPVLAFHELGHYVAMRIFGYRNLRMFFIPFFGAGVTGKHYNIAGWKKAVVALAGPLPGIALGTAIGAVGLALREPIVIQVATWMLFLNGFNLLPFLPLDGGWVVHAVLFVRHPALDVVFRVVAALCLVPIAYFFSAWLLYAVAFFVLAAAPMAYRTARIARRLGEEGLVTRSVDGQSIPDETALRILGELRPVLSAQIPAKTMAQHVANVFEAFNAAPPGPLASLGLLCLQGGGFVMAAVVAVVVNMP